MQEDQRRKQAKEQQDQQREKERKEEDSRKADTRDKELKEAQGLSTSELRHEFIRRRDQAQAFTHSISHKLNLLQSVKRQVFCVADTSTFHAVVKC